MKALDIVREKLIEMGADGLCTDGCGCGVDGLAPCCDYFGRCVPAKKIELTEDNIQELDHECIGYIGDDWFVPLEQRKGGE